MEYYEIPFADDITRELSLYDRSLDDLRRQRIRFQNRGQDYVTGEVRSEYMLLLANDALKPVEEDVRRKLDRLMRKHPMADWLTEAKTMGSRVGAILSAIRHPHRFPGQLCTEGHHLLPVFEHGSPCPCAKKVDERDADPEPCPGTVEPLRPGTGCRALWHFCGMYPIEDGKGKIRLARRVKGQQASYNSVLKTAIMMPQGVAQQFFMQGSRYAATYYEAKDRLAFQHPDWTAGQKDGTARVIAAKAWLGDLLTEWKVRVPLAAVIDGGCEIEAGGGASSEAA